MIVTEEVMSVVAVTCGYGALNPKRKQKSRCRTLCTHNS